MMERELAMAIVVLALSVIGAVLSIAALLIVAFDL